MNELELCVSVISGIWMQGVPTGVHMLLQSQVHFFSLADEYTY